MSDYKRFISYIYAYDRGIKSKNVGFAKLEVRNGECRITINIKGAFAASGKELEVYLFRREKEKMVGTCLGTFSAKNGTGEFRTITAAGNISGSGLPLERMAGLILKNREEEARIYASGWDDSPIVPERFVTEQEETDRKSEEAALTMEREELSAAEIIPVMEAVEEELKRLGADTMKMERLVQPEIQPQSQPEIGPVTEPVTEPEPVRIPVTEPVTEPEPVQIPVTEPVTGPEPVRIVSQGGAGTVSASQGLWSSLENKFPRVAAFEDDPDIPCLKIDLKDLEYLPRKNWGLASNSFLLHGYYNFRYLILAKMGENQYMLGIPGMFHNNERFMAAMFGFDHFKPVKDYKPLTGHFGYWYQWVEM